MGVEGVWGTGTLALGSLLTGLGRGSRGVSYLWGWGGVDGGLGGPEIDQSRSWRNWLDREMGMLEVCLLSG